MSYAPLSIEQARSQDDPLADDNNEAVLAARVREAQNAIVWKQGGRLMIGLLLATFVGAQILWTIVSHYEKQDSSSPRPVRTYDAFANRSELDTAIQDYLGAAGKSTRTICAFS